MLVPSKTPGRRDASIARITAQLDDWSRQLDALVVGYLEAGAHTNDPYRLRVDGLRNTNASVRVKLAAYSGPSPQSGPVSAFRESVADEWRDLETSLHELVH